jgi:hypothetical protein
MEDRNFIQPIVAKAIHIDTVRLSHAYRSLDLPSYARLKELRLDIHSKRRKGNWIHTAYAKPFGNRPGEPHISVILSENPYSYSGIKIECSLAKLVDGTGISRQTDKDIDSGLDAIEDTIRMVTGVEFDARTAKVGRFDVNADFPVGAERIKLYEEALSRPHASLTPGTFGDSSKYFFNGSRTFAIYDKQKEVETRFKKGKASREEVIAAQGLLRIEGRLKTPQAVSGFAKKLSCSNIACELITTDVALAFSSDLITQLSLDKPKFSGEARTSMLIEEFGKNAPEMIGILMLKEWRGEEFWKELGWTETMYYRKKRVLVAANLWNTSPYEALPALVILPDDDNNPTSLSPVTPTDLPQALPTAEGEATPTPPKRGFLKRR